MKKYDEWFNEGVDHIQNNEFKQALECFEEALRLNKNDHKLFSSLGFIYYNFGENEKAIEYFKRAVKLNNQDLFAWLQIGIIYMDTLEFEKAIHSFQKILEFTPGYGQAKNMIALCLRQIPVFSNLKPQLEKLNETLRMKFLQGIKLHNKGKYYEAELAFKEVIKGAPNFSPVWTWLATNSSNSGKFEEAIDHFNKAINLSPNDFRAWCNKGLTLNRLKRFEEALKCYDKAIEINPQYSSAWNNKGLAFKELKRFHESIACFDQSISANPNLEFGWINKAEVLVKIGRDEEAIECYKEALKLNPSRKRAKEMIDHLKIKTSMVDINSTGKVSFEIKLEYCPNCGEKDYTNSPFCPTCGFEKKSKSVL